MAATNPYSGISARIGAPFTFTKNGTEPFFPGAGSKLRFASKDVDALTLADMPAGYLASGDTVRVTYNGTCVFSGEVANIVQDMGRGSEVRERVTVAGPWNALQRLVFRQTWNLAVDGHTLSYSSPHVILNQKFDGSDQNMAQQMQEIAGFAAEPCGFSYDANNVSISSVQLPKDEAHDITCADAIARVLRFFPRKTVRFDYSSATPALHIHDPSGTTDAAYLDGIPKTARRYERNAHPVTAVDVYTDDVDVEADGTSLKRNHQLYPETADADAIDVLHAYIPLEPGTSAAEYEKLEVVTEEIGVVNGVANEKKWWMSKHPRLANVAADTVTISEFGYAFPSFSPRRITDCTVGALKKFGCEAEVVRFHCYATINGKDDVEEKIYLTMDFVVTNASTRTYTQQVASSSSAGEDLPDGLAQAIYEERAGSLLNEYVSIRLGNTLPVLGDLADGLVLQEYTVDLETLTAELHFGHPEFLSFEDMRSLLNGFRQKAFAASAALRATGEPDAEDAQSFAGIQPVSSTEFCPGTKAKTTFKGGNVAGKAVIDVKDLDGKTAKFIDVTVGEKSYKVLGADMDAEPEDEEEDDDPHDQDDPHEADTPDDPCDPSGDGDGDGSGGGGGAGVAGEDDSGAAAEGGATGSAGVKQDDRDPPQGDGESSAPGCNC